MHADQRQGRRPSIVLIFAITVTGITVNSLVTPAVPDILQGLGASAGSAGILIAAATLPGIFMAPAFGVLADRYGRREVLIPCLVLFGVSGGLGAAATSIWMLIGLRLLQGAGSAGLINLAVVLIGDHWDGAGRVRMIGRNSAVLTVSIVLFPSVGGLLVDAGGWRAPFLVYPVSIVTALFVLRLPRRTAQAQRVGDQMTEAWPYLRSPAMLAIVGISVVAFSLIFGAMITLMPLYAAGEFGLRASARGVILSLPAATATLGSLTLSRAQLAFGRRRVLVAGMVLFCLALAGVARAPSLPILAAAVLVFGLGEGFLIPGLQDLAAGLAPATTRGTVVAAWVGSARTGQTIGPLIASASYTAFGASPTFAGGAALAGLTAAAMIAGGRTVPRLTATG